MLAQAKSGLKLKGVLDPGQAAHDWAARSWLKHPNIELFVPERKGDFKTLRKLHHKPMVIDEKVVVAGSFNYTRPANEFNDENIFVLGSVFSEVEGVSVGAAPSRALAKHMKAKIERIIAGSKPHTP